MGVVFSIHNEENVITPRSTSIFTSPPPSGASQWLSLTYKVVEYYNDTNICVRKRVDSIFLEKASRFSMKDWWFSVGRFDYKGT